MVSSFSRETPILHLRLRPHTQHTATRAYILWPAWMYRVVAPRARRRDLDLFQKAILKLCQTGMRQASDIGDKLRIHGDLVDFIIERLQEKNLIGHDGLPTPVGLEVLANEEFYEDDMMVGYVFQDPWKGSLWPRFVEQIDYAEREVRDDDYVRINLGSIGVPSFLNAHMQFPNDVAAPIPPTAEEILRTTVDQSRALSRAEALPEVEDEWEGDIEVRHTRLRRISLVDEVPQPVFLTTYLYSVDDPEEWGNWYVCDPFGLGASYTLHRAIDKQRAESKGLTHALERVLGYDANEDDQEYSRRPQELRRKAEWKLENELHLNLGELSYGEYLCDMGTTYEEVVSYGERCPTQKLRHVLNDARICLEQLLFHMGQDYAIQRAWKWVSANNKPIVEDWARLREIYERAARSVGFKSPLSEPLQRTKANKVRSVAQYQGRELNAMIVANLLVSQEDPGHPFREVAQTNPDLLEIMSQTISETSSRGAHAEKAPSMAVVDQTVQMIHQIVRCIENNRSNLSGN